MPMKNITNLVLFQVAWLCCVLLGSTAAILITLAILLVHFLYVAKKAWEIELILVCVVALTGIAIDTLLLHLGLYQFETAEPNAYEVAISIIPAWLMCLWVNFSLTLRHSMKWLFERPVALFFISLIAAPWSYYAGKAFGSIDFEMTTLFVIAVYWGVLMFVVSWGYRSLLSKRELI